MKKNIKDLVRQFLVSFIALGAVLLFATVASAWSGPAGAPPSSNAPAPLNVSSSQQEKSGSLVLDKGMILNFGGTAANALVIPTGNLQLGSVTNCSTLGTDVNGNVTCGTTSGASGAVYQ